MKSKTVRITVIAPAVLCGVFILSAYRDASALTKDQATALAVGSRSRWWDLVLAAIVVGSWTYYLLVIAGRVLDLLGLLSFALTSGTVAAFVTVALAAGAAGAAWYSRPIRGMPR